MFNTYRGYAFLLLKSSREILLPARMEGLGVRDPVELCDVDLTSSQAGATVISDVVRGFAEFDWSEHLARVQATSVSHCQRD